MRLCASYPQPTHADLTDEGQTLYYPEIKTTAKDIKTEDHQGVTGEDTVIVDTVSYSNLIAGKTYTVKGVLMDKDTGEAIKVDGKEVTSEKTFTATEKSGTVTMKFIFDSKALKGKTTVVFEDLYMGDVNVTTHSDITDEGQSIHYPEIKTMATDQMTKDNLGTIGNKTTIVDAVSYSNLIAGKTYTVKGVLMNKETGKPLKVDGKEVTAEKTFTAEKANGTVELKYAFDSRKLEGKTVVVFENLYHQGIKVTTHSAKCIR